MKILLLSDEECSRFWDHYSPGMFREYELILAAGDLKAEYLSFIVTMANRPLLYVHGNHDGRYAQQPPEGCQCIDGQLVKIKGLRILGLGGSMLYNGGPHQYSEKQMRRRIRRLRFRLWRMGGADIVLSHAPIAGCGDMEDRAHRGFECFGELARRLRPAYWVHGHIHRRYGAAIARRHSLGSTEVINACGCYELEI